MNKDYFRNLFRAKRAGFYIGFLVSVFMLIADVIYIILDMGDITFSVWGFALILAGSVVGVASLFFTFQFMPLVASILFSCGTFMHLYTGIPSVTDIINDINFFGGNGWMCIIFGILFLVGSIAMCISCCFEQKSYSHIALEQC